MYDKHVFLVPTDFSACAKSAVRCALALARPGACTLHFAHVIDPGAYAVPVVPSGAADTFDRAEATARRALAECVTEARSLGMRATLHVLRGSVTGQLLHLAHEIQPTLMIMGSHGRSGVERLVLGSVCEKLIRQAPAPVLTVKHRDAADSPCGHLKRILWPTDFSPYAQASLPWAVWLAKRFDATLVLAHVVFPYVDALEYLPEFSTAHVRTMSEEAGTKLGHIAQSVVGVNVETAVLTGYSHRELSHFAEDSHVDLVVMSTHGRGGVAHMLFGSVAEKTLRMVRCPILTVRPAAVEQTAPSPIAWAAAQGS